MRIRLLAATAEKGAECLPTPAPPWEGGLPGPRTACGISVGNERNLFPTVIPEQSVAESAEVQPFLLWMTDCAMCSEVSHGSRSRSPNASAPLLVSGVGLTCAQLFDETGVVDAANAPHNCHRVWTGLLCYFAARCTISRSGGHERDSGTTPAFVLTRHNFLGAHF